jgi:hypothetical protein
MEFSISHAAAISEENVGGHSRKGVNFTQSA